MVKAQRIRKLILWGGLSLLISLLSRQTWWPVIWAQEEDDTVNAHRMFLPYVADGSGRSTDQHDDHTHTHPQPLHNAWPPQPEGVTDVVWLATTPSAEIIAAENRLRSVEQQSVQAAAVQAALGERFVRATSAYVEDKAAMRAAAAAGVQPPTTVRVTYFSYSHNATVEVLVQDDTVIDVKQIPAAVYQPEPTHSEKQRAIALARSHFAAQGFARIQQLQGYVIQAYQPEGSTGFYANRILYVTFHERIDERPEFVAWVDLTQETIHKALQDQFQVTPGGEAQ